MNSGHSAGPPLDIDHHLREAWIQEAAVFIHRQLDGLSSAPATGLGPQQAAQVLAGLPRGLPAEPISLSAALDHIERAATLGLQPGGPGYLAYIPGGGIFAAALASFVSLTLNRFVGLAAAAPALVRFEQDVIDFFGLELGMPDTRGGILTSGGSMSNLSAVIAARVRAFGDGGDFSQATVYLSAEAHRSMAKAARLAGIPLANLRTVPVDPALRMDASALASIVAIDRQNGFQPFLVSAAAGTTNTGAIDPLTELAHLCASESLWFHVDGAYGGMFVLTDEGRDRLRGIELADSVTLDPHKGLFLPYGCGALVVRDQDTLHQAHSDNAGYLQDLQGTQMSPSPSELGTELSRNDRGILVWLPLALHGIDAFRQALSEKLRLARYFRSALVDLPIEVPVEPELSIVAFRLPRNEHEELATWNARNRAWLERINDCRRVHLSSTLLPTEEGATVTLRVCILSFRTDRARIELALEDLIATLDGDA